MITLVIGITAGCGGYVAAYYAADWGIGWSVFAALLAFGLVQGVLGFFLQRRIKADMQAVQMVLEAGQKRLQQKTQRWQVRPPGSIQAAQKEIFEDTKIFVKQAMEKTVALEKYRLWVPMIERQIATARVQLSWMIKDFKTVDRLLPKVLFIDPMVSALKMARYQMQGKPIAEIEKIYQKGVRRVRYNDNVLLAATMSWIQVHRDDPSAAFKTLTEALKKSDNEVLKHNHECLMNNKVAHFTNSGLGDQWYSLFLEEPKVRMQRQRNVYR